MGKEKAVSNTGPIIHLSEIKAKKALKIFSSIFCPLSVQKELSNYIDTSETRFLKTKKLNQSHKQLSEMLHVRFEISPAEAEAIALCKQAGIKIFLTDDLGARIVSKKFGRTPVGSIGILLRAFREKILSQSQAIKFLEELEYKSSLFITPDLIKEAIQQAEKFSKKQPKSLL